MDGGGAVPTQALSPGPWSAHGTDQPSRRHRKLEFAVKPKEGDCFLSFDGLDTVFLITVMIGCVCAIGCGSYTKATFACLACGNWQLDPQHYGRKMVGGIRVSMLYFR